VLLAAMVMGLPTLRGGFVGGDDHRLALDHVLVNRPSLTHAIELFAITHRDLYQPLPLLTFSFEFLVVEWLGLSSRGPEGFAWLFHLDNVILHAINSLLVWTLIRRFHESALSRSGDVPVGYGSVDSRMVATVAAMLFAVHPLQTEVVAWVNGRMMLLSTMFAVLSLLAVEKFVNAIDGRRTPGIRRRAGWACLVILFTLLCAISKIRIELPLLMLVTAWLTYRNNGLSPDHSPTSDKKSPTHRLFTAPFVIVWLACAAITAVFVLINVQATSEADLFSGGAVHLHGPKAVRVIQALAFYFTKALWPVGLASYHPTPPVVAWSDPETWEAIAVVVPSLLVMIGAAARSLVARLGFFWFFAAIAATLPIVPARNVLAADRYMYLPFIGLLWAVATLLVRVNRRWISECSGWVRRGLVPLSVIAVVIVLIIQCWNVAWYYETPLKKTLRIAELFPDVPRVWERLGWSHHELGQYDEAIECAKKEFHHDAPNVLSCAYQLVGMSELKRDHPEEALDWLHRAVEIDPENALGKYRLAMAYDELGRVSEALPFYEAALVQTPLHNPTIHRLATVYRRLGRPEDARRMYEKEIENNAYEVPAVLGLVELDLEVGTQEALLRAVERLEQLLDRMPGEPAVLVSYGVVQFALGRREEAKGAYHAALARDAGNVTAMLNLAQLYHAGGDTEKARSLLDRAASVGLTSWDQARAVADVYESIGAWDRASFVWQSFQRHHPMNREATAFAAWADALNDRTKEARTLARSVLDDASVAPPAAQSIAHATLAYVGLVQGDQSAMWSHVGALTNLGDSATPDRARLLRALERFDAGNPEHPLTYCLTAELLIANQIWDAARAALPLCEQRCQTTDCETRIAAMRARIP